ncbi:MAG: hypothetical protein ABUT39_03085 [Acidobacteriota bacterium]
MSWWDTPDGRVLGDGPADLFRAALRSFAKRRRPTLPELLAAAGEALGTPGLVASREGGPDVQAAEGPADADLVSALREAFEAIRTEYRTYVDREPELEEILETIDFIVGYRPERFLSDTEGLEILAIRSGT